MDNHNIQKFLRERERENCKPMVPTIPSKQSHFIFVKLSASFLIPVT